MVQSTDGRPLDIHTNLPVYESFDHKGVKPERLGAELSQPTDEFASYAKQIAHCKGKYFQ